MTTSFVVASTAGLFLWQTAAIAAAPPAGPPKIIVGAAQDLQNWIRGGSGRPFVDDLVNASKGSLTQLLSIVNQLNTYLATLPGTTLCISLKIVQSYQDGGVTVCVIEGTIAFNI